MYGGAKFFLNLGDLGAKLKALGAKLDDLEASFKALRANLGAVEAKLRALGRLGDPSMGLGAPCLGL